MRENVRVLKVLHGDEGSHVKEPEKRPVRGARPHADETKVDLQRQTYSTRRHNHGLRIYRNVVLWSNCALLSLLISIESKEKPRTAKKRVQHFFFFYLFFSLLPRAKLVISQRERERNTITRHRSIVINYRATRKCRMHDELSCDDRWLQIPSSSKKVHTWKISIVNSN